ncbi:MAG: LytTR family transcriptional regulator DNA-binding domain-containing protein [Tannerellaceae bacterium]|nr:LytTR family transcriptional regulator DNA-binding domain-containing protein [Tannerellaceae bacterium]
MKKNTKDLNVYSETEIPGTASSEQEFDKLLRNHHLAIQTVTGIVMLKYSDILLFEYINTHKWQVRLADDKTFPLRPSVTSRDILSILPAFVQINQNCIINLTHLTLIENKTLKCLFDVPYLGSINIEISPLYYKKMKENLNIL